MVGMDTNARHSLGNASGRSGLGMCQRSICSSASRRCYKGVGPIQVTDHATPNQYVHVVECTWLARSAAGRSSTTREVAWGTLLGRCLTAALAERARRTGYAGLPPRGVAVSTFGIQSSSIICGMDGAG